MCFHCLTFTLFVNVNIWAFCHICVHWCMSIEKKIVERCDCCDSYRLLLAEHFPLRMKMNCRPWTDAPLVICHSVNHAVKANCVVGKSIVSGTLLDKAFTRVGGWNESCNKETDAERSVNKSFVNAANSSAENTEPEMRGDEEVVMSSWAKEERLMKWFECLEVEKGKIWTHNQRPWNQTQSYSMSVHLDWFKNLSLYG